MSKMKGKILSVSETGCLFAKGYSLKDTRTEYGVNDPKFYLLSRYSLSRRFLRAEITSFYHLANGDKIAENIYKEDYLDQAKRVHDYIIKNGQIPNFVIRRISFGASALHARLQYSILSSTRQWWRGKSPPARRLTRQLLRGFH